MTCRPELRGRGMRLAPLLRDLEAEHGVRADLASSGGRLREDDASRAAFGGNGSNTSHFEACLLEAAADVAMGWPTNLGHRYASGASPTETRMSTAGLLTSVLSGGGSCATT